MFDNNFTLFGFFMLIVVLIVLFIGVWKDCNERGGALVHGIFYPRCVEVKEAKTG